MITGSVTQPKERALLPGSISYTKGNVVRFAVGPRGFLVVFQESVLKGVTEVP